MKKSIIILSLLACVSNVLIASNYVSSLTPSDRRDENKSPVRPGYAEATPDAAGALVHRNFSEGRISTGGCTPSCHKPEKKRTCAPTPISHATAIKHSGCYCLTRDITGTIVIDADDVMLDLNCHHIDADGAANAVSAQGHTGVTVKNGSIVNATQAGIAIIACEEVVVTDITFRNNADISLSIQAESVGSCPVLTVTNPSQGIWVSNLDISQGNRAMLFRGCNELHVESCYAYNNTNTIANAVVSVESCNDVFFEEVFVNNNIKAVPGQTSGPLSIIGLEQAVFLVQATNNIILRNCTTNNNSCQLVPRTLTGLYIVGFSYLATDGVIDCFVPAAPQFPDFLSSGVIIEGHQSNANTNTTGSLTGIYVSYVPNIIVRDSQTNGNVTSHAQNGNGFFGSTDFLSGLIFVACPGINIKNHQANQNISFGAEVQAILIVPFFDGNGNIITCDGTLIEDTVTNDNGDQSPDGTSFCAGIGLSFGFAQATSSGAIIRGCQANGNKANAKATGYSLLWNNTVIEDCQADNNSSNGAPDPANNAASTATTGFVTRASNNCTFISCIASNNTCVNGYAAGIDAASEVPFVPGHAPILLTLPATNVVVQNCVTNSNSSTNNVSYGVHLLGALNSEVIDCTAIGNQVGFQDSLPPATLTSSIATNGPVTITTGSIAVVSGTGILTAPLVAGGQLFAGQALSGTGVIPGTIITSFVGGVPGGAGAYTVNIPVPVATTTITATNPSTTGVLSVSATTGPLFPGQVISGAGVTPGTIVAGYITATGGTGDYVINSPSPIVAVASEPMTATTSQNSFFGNRAENTPGVDYQNIPTGNTVDFLKSSATFVPTPPNRWSNLAILP